MNYELGVWIEFEQYHNLKDYLPDNEELSNMKPEFGLLKLMTDKKESFSSWITKTFQKDECFDTTEYKILSYILMQQPADWIYGAEIEELYPNEDEGTYPVILNSEFEDDGLYQDSIQDIILSILKYDKEINDKHN